MALFYDIPRVVAQFYDIPGSTQVAKMNATPMGSVHISRDDIVLCMWLNTWCVFIFCRGDSIVKCV